MRCLYVKGTLQDTNIELLIIIIIIIIIINGNAVKVLSFDRYKVQGGSNMTGTDLCLNKPHCAATVRP